MKDSFVSYNVNMIGKSSVSRLTFFFVTILIVGFASPVFADVNTDQRAALQAQLDQIEKDIANNQGTLSTLQAQRTTLERDISILDTKIKKAQLQIKQSDVVLTQLSHDITDKQQSINQVQHKISDGQESLAEILRETRAIDDTPMVTLALSSDSISSIFKEVDNFETIQKALGDAFTRLQTLHDQLTGVKQALEEKQGETAQARQAQVIAKQQVLDDEKQKVSILTTTKGQEKTYQQLIADKQKQASAIREALFGLRDTGAIAFGTAYGYAKEASAATGVTPALILAILTQESSLGVNTGSCYVKDLSTGAGVGKNTGKAFATVMKAPRDTVPFQTIADHFGRDWSTTAVSCPQGVGYGGAMGPAQFIPSTWALYQSRLASATGQSFPDPWNARTAIFATALLMKDNGATGGSRTSERTAALKYFAGGNWSKPANAPYGDNVMDHRDAIQAEIDILNGSSS